MLALTKLFLLFGAFFVYSYMFINLVFSELNNKRTKVTLSLFMLIASVFFCLTVIKTLTYFHLFRYTHNFYWSILLTAFPLLYLYASSLFDKRWFKPRLAIHFSPFMMMYLIGVIIHTQYSIDEIETYLNLLVSDPEKVADNYAPLMKFKKSICIIYLLQGVGYAIYIYFIFRHHKKQFSNLFSNTLNTDLIRLRAIVFLIIAISIVYNIGVNYIGLDYIWLKNGLVTVVLIFIILFTGILGILGAKQNSIYDLDIECLKKEKQSNENQTDLKLLILHLFEKKEIFLNKDLTIWDLCRLANSNRTYISNLINQEFQMNFNTFVNKYRIKKAKELIKSEKFKEKPLETIAMEAGFNSLASFNRAFKRFEEISPGNYRVN